MRSSGIILGLILAVRITAQPIDGDYSSLLQEFMYFTFKSGGVCRRFWRHFSLADKINPDNSLYQDPCLAQGRTSHAETEFEGAEN